MFFKIILELKNNSVTWIEIVQGATNNEHDCSRDMQKNPTKFKIVDYAVKSLYDILFLRFVFWGVHCCFPNEMFLKLLFFIIQ